MGLGRALTRQMPAPVRQHNRMIVSNGFRLGPNAVLGDASGNPSPWTTGDYAFALAIPGAWRAAMLISDLIGRLPWNAYTDTATGQAELVTPTPPLLEQPDPTDDRMSTFSAWALDLVHHGNALGIYADWDNFGEPTAVLPVRATAASVRRANGSTNSAIPNGAVEYLIGGQTFSADEVLHIKGPHAPGALRGMGVLEHHFATLDLAHEQRRQARNVAGGEVPLGVLEATDPDITVEEMQEVKAAFVASQRDRTIAALAAAKFTPISWNPEQGQMIEARQLTLTEIALIYGLPPMMIAAQTGGSMDYTSTEIEALQLLKFGSPAGHLARFEHALSLAFPPGTVAKANLDALLRSDTKSRYEAHAIGIRAGFLRRSEVREIEDLPPVDGIDDQPTPSTATTPASPGVTATPTANGYSIGVPS